MDKLTIDKTKDLISQIYELLDDKSSSIVTLLNKAARLANLLGDDEMLRLFEIHLEGVDNSTRVALDKEISRYTKQGKPSRKIVEMSMYDREMGEGIVSSHSAHDLERLFHRLDSYVSSDNWDAETYKDRNQCERVIIRIRNRVNSYARIVEANMSKISEIESASAESSLKKIFIGHGRSEVWRDLKDFLQDRLHLEWDEFNRESTAGLSTKERLEEMLNDASFAFLIMTGEDEHADLSLHARENVIHEIGLFQGKLGFRKAIVLLEEGCKEFSNIIGLTQIRFPKGNIEAKFEELRRVLERERILEVKR